MSLDQRFYGPTILSDQKFFGHNIENFYLGIECGPTQSYLYDILILPKVESILKNNVSYKQNSLRLFLLRGVGYLKATP